MKFFIDTANLSQIEKAQNMGILDGNLGVVVLVVFQFDRRGIGRCIARRYHFT